MAGVRWGNVPRALALRRSLGGGRPKWPKCAIMVFTHSEISLSGSRDTLDTHNLPRNSAI